MEWCLSELKLLTVKAVHQAYLSGNTIRSASDTGNLCLCAAVSDTYCTAIAQRVLKHAR